MTSLMPGTLATAWRQCHMIGWPAISNRGCEVPNIRDNGLKTRLAVRKISPWVDLATMVESEYLWKVPDRFLQSQHTSQRKTWAKYPAAAPLACQGSAEQKCGTTA